MSVSNYVAFHFFIFITFLILSAGFWGMWISRTKGVLDPRAFRSHGPVALVAMIFTLFLLGSMIRFFYVIEFATRGSH